MNKNKKFKITFLTGNKFKIQSAKTAFKKYPEIELLTLKTHTVEIQSLDVEEVAKYTVWEAANRLKIPVFKMDSGYYFTGLNGFPGPFIKYFVQSLTSEDILRLLQNKSKEVIIKESLAYCEPGQDPIAFTAEIKAQIAQKPMGQGSSVDRLIVYEGFDKPQAACNREEIIKYWNKHLNHYEQFAKWLMKNRVG